jgi:hypothetical protein
MGLGLHRASLHRYARNPRLRVTRFYSLAEGLIDFDELRSKLSALEADRKTAAHDLQAVRDKAERLASFKLKTEALIEAYSRKARLGLDLSRSKIGSTPTKPSGESNRLPRRHEGAHRRVAA